MSKSFVDENHKVSLLPWKSKKMFRAISGITLDVKQGETYGVLGHNGCGKSTLIRMIATLLIPDKGEIRVFGKDVYKSRAAVKKLINRVSVEASFFKRLSARENLIYAARLYGMDVADAEKKAKAILKQIGFPMKKYDEPVEKYSRGLQQKVAITRGFLTTPRLLLLDEPTTGLDPKSKKEVQMFIRSIRKKHDVTLMLSSHDMDEVDALCDRIAIMNSGRIVAEGTGEELKKLVQENDKYEIVTSQLKDVYLALKDVEGVLDIKVADKKVVFESKKKILPKVVQKLNGLDFEQINTVKPTLEDVFLHLTGKSLSDQEE